MKNFGRSFKLGLVGLVLGVSTLISALGQVTSNGWNRYQVILDKDPFGRLGPAEPAAIPDFAKNLRLCSSARINNDLYGGFYDSVNKTDFLLKKGETGENGITLDDVDMLNESAKISSAGLSATLYVQSLPTLTNAPAGMVLGNSSSLASSSQNNPWKEFYQRYQQRHANEVNPSSPVSVAYDVRNPDGSSRVLTDAERRAVITQVQNYQVGQQGGQQTIQQTRKTQGVNPNIQQQAVQQSGVQVEQFSVQTDQSPTKKQSSHKHSKNQAQ